MGIVNVTADSFSDGGRSSRPRGDRPRPEAARTRRRDDRRGRRVHAPGRRAVAAAEECARVIPVVEALVREGVPVSVDTMKPEVMRAALDAGAAS
jgi:dihydropteroate synthase